jgi:phage tail-like protein
MTAELDEKRGGYEPAPVPLHAFRFFIRIERSSGSGLVSEGAFAECTGLEATMEPKVVKAGGSNYGAIQLPGPVTFSTVVLKRGITSSYDLFEWFADVASGRSYKRKPVHIAVRDPEGNNAITWVLTRCLPVKFKAADLNAKGGEVGIEELHLAHEGLFLVTPEKPAP